MADELPDNIDLNWIGRTLLNLQRDVRDGFAELRDDIAELKRLRGDDRSLLEDVAREVGMEPTPARLSQETFEAETNRRLERIEAKVFPPAE
jgi:hypothetical protein